VESPFKKNKSMFQTSDHHFAKWISPIETSPL